MSIFMLLTSYSDLKSMAINRKTSINSTWFSIRPFMLLWGGSIQHWKLKQANYNCLLSLPVSTAAAKGPNFGGCILHCLLLIVREISAIFWSLARQDQTLSLSNVACHETVKICHLSLQVSSDSESSSAEFSHKSDRISNSLHDRLF